MLHLHLFTFYTILNIRKFLTSYFISKFLYNSNHLFKIFCRNLQNFIDSSSESLSNLFRDRNRNIKSIIQVKSTCKSLKKWRRHTFKRTRVCLNISKFFYIATISQHQVDFTAMKRNWQSCKSLKKCWTYTINSSMYLFERFATLLHRKDFETFKEVSQSKVQNYIQCENVKFEKFSTMYDDLSKTRNVSIQERENQQKILIQISHVSAFTFSHFLIISDFNKQTNDRRTIREFLISHFSKLYRSLWTFRIVNSLRLHLKRIRINHKFNFCFSRSSQKLRSKREKYFVFAIYSFDIKYLMLICFVNQIASISHHICVDSQFDDFSVKHATFQSSLLRYLQSELTSFKELNRVKNIFRDCCLILLNCERITNFEKIEKFSTRFSNAY